MRVNIQHLSLDTPSDSYLPGGLKNYSTQKVVTYSDSTRKIVQENVICFLWYHFEFGHKSSSNSPKKLQIFVQYADWAISPIWVTSPSLHTGQKFVTFWESLSHFCDLIQNGTIQTKNIFLHSFSGRVRISNHFLFIVIFWTPREIVTRGSYWG